MTEKRIKTIIQLIVIGAVTLVAALLVTIIVQFSMRGYYAGRERVLKEQLEKLQAETKTIEQEIEYRKTQEYIEKYAHEMGLVKDGEVKYTPEG